jgi:hypothetical protein
MLATSCKSNLYTKYDRCLLSNHISTCLVAEPRHAGRQESILPELSTRTKEKELSKKWTTQNGNSQESKCIF